MTEMCVFERCTVAGGMLQRIGQSTDLHQEESGLTATASLQATDRHTDSRRRTAAKVPASRLQPQSPVG